MSTGGLRAVLEDKRVLFCLTVAAVAVAFLGPVADYDLWWHMRAGRLIFASHSIPQTDPFSFTAAGRPWLYHSWLSGLILSGIWGAAGPVGIILFRSALLAASLMIAWATALRRGAGAALAAILVLASCLQLELRALERPFLFSLLLFTVFALLLQECVSSPPPDEDYRRRLSGGGRGWLSVEDSFLWGRGGRLLLLPLLMVLWANLHAGFISGMLLIGAYGAGEMVSLAANRGHRRWTAMLLSEVEGARFRAMLVAGVLCLVAAVMTPYGPETLLYPFWLTQTVKLVRRVQEWQPMPLSLNFAVFWTLVAFAAVAVGRSVWFSVREGRIRREAGQIATDVLLLAGFAFLAARSVRHMEWFLLLVPAVVGWHLEAFARPGFGQAVASQAPPRRAYGPVACLLAVIMGAWPFVAGGLPEFGVARDKLPVAACDYMEGHKLDCRLYNTYEWGGYLIWRFWPRMHVFIDGRCEVYLDDLMGQAIAVEDGSEGWPQVLARWDVRMLLVRYRKRDSSHLFSRDGWRCVYWDDVAVIGLRDDVYAGRARDLPVFDLSNPLRIEESLATSPPDDILAEAEAVLARDPNCWTAHALRARCLVRMAESDAGRRDALLRQALDSARRAVRLEDGHYETWQALAEAATAAGDCSLAAAASRRVGDLQPQ